MLAVIAFGTCYVLVPVCAYNVVATATGSTVAAGLIGAGVSVPVGVVFYVRIFEWVKRRVRGTTPMVRS